jgi:hypothetical protein
MPRRPSPSPGTYWPGASSTERSSASAGFRRPVSRRAASVRRRPGRCVGRGFPVSWLR